MKPLSHLCYTATQTRAEAPHSPRRREELSVIIVGSVQEQDALCRAANIQKQQPSFDEDVYVNGKREPIMLRDEHLPPEHVAKQVHVELHFEDPASSAPFSASVRRIHCIVCIALWTGDVYSMKARINNLRNAIMEWWFQSDECRSWETMCIEDLPVLVVVLNPGPLSLEDFSLRVHEQLPSATVFAAFEVNKSELPPAFAVKSDLPSRAKSGFAQEFTHTVAFLAGNFSLKAHRDTSMRINFRPMSKPPKKGTSCC